MIKNKQKDAIFGDFLAWICGIQEDFPIPREICNVYFVLDFSNNDIVLSYSGDEKRFDFFDLGMYCTHEGEYLFSNELKNLSKDIFEHKKTISKNEVFDMIKNIVFVGVKRLEFLKSKRIFFGLMHSKVT